MSARSHLRLLRAKAGGISMSKEQTGQRVEKLHNKSEEQYSEDRRRVLKKLGTYGLYTAPIMLAMLDSAKATPVVSRAPS
jgi:hypothetical protein